MTFRGRVAFLRPWLATFTLWRLPWSLALGVAATTVSPPLASSTQHEVPVVTSTAANPLSALAGSLGGVIYALLNLLAVIVTFSTITVPSTIYTILHYSFTLQLNFPSIALLFISTLVSALFWLRYRHLNRYERLREVPLEKDSGFDLHPDVAGAADDAERGGGFHNYLDDFLQAIRIFGYLEKPVFHELARHLQTRRLIAGDSLSLDSDFSFYIVIDGNVQVFAPLPGSGAAVSPDDYPDNDSNEFNGFQLLNEVGSGGTLSSLFTILSLFTEDVKLSRFDEGTPSATASASSHAHGTPLSHATQPNAHHSSSPYPATVPTQLNAAALRQVPNAMDGAVDRLGPDARTAAVASPGSLHVEQASSSSSESTRGTVHPQAEFTEGAGDCSPGPTELTMPPAQGTAPFPHFAPSQNPQSASSSQHAGGHLSSPPFLARMRDRKASSGFFEGGRPFTPGSNQYGTHPRAGNDAVHHEALGTVARATVDTTLAVIPAEAFRRLTMKYPTAAAHIVQGEAGNEGNAKRLCDADTIFLFTETVILTRLSRVTLHTAHQYLGLTKEVMRIEKQLNERATFLLPGTFYEQGGMERLRQRFLPEPKREATLKPEREPHEPTQEEGYFRRTASPNDGLAQIDVNLEVRRSATSSAENTATPFDRVSDKTPWGHPDLPVRTPSLRNTVGPGDLFTMTGGDDSIAHSTGYSATLATPRPSQRVTSSGSALTSITEADGTSHGTKSRAVPSSQKFGTSLATDMIDEESTSPAWTALGLSDFDLKDEVMQCIARSIGLAQAPPSPHASVQASPFLNPADVLLQRSVFNSAFSSLSMLDVAGAGMDDTSSSGITGNTAESMTNAQLLESLENEVDIRFFEADSVLVKAGDAHNGLFYVIDGFLDVIIPPSRQDAQLAKPEQQMQGPAGSTTRRAPSDVKSVSREKAAQEAKKRGTTNASNRGSASSNTPRRPTDPLQSVEPSAFGNALDGTLKSRDSASARQSTLRPSNSGRQGRDGRFTGRPATRSPAASQAPSQSRNTRTGFTNGSGQSPEGRTGQKPNNGNVVYSIGRGGVAGYLSTLLGSTSYVDVRAKTDCYIGFLPAHALERMMERRPLVLLTLCKRLLGLLSPLILHIDSALDWQQVNAGQVIYREGTPADSFYIVITGRLRAIVDRPGSGQGIEIMNEYGQGDSVGELDVITNSPRGKTLHAIRDSELAKMPMTLFNAISVRHPAITIQISRIIARRVREEMYAMQRPGGSAGSSRSAPIPGLPDLGRNNLNLKTVAILPVTQEVPVSDFANRLQTAFEDTIGGPTAFLNQSSVMSVLGRHAFNRMGKLKLAGWLAEQEQKYRLVFYVVDTPVSSPWSQTCIRQADCVLLVGFGDDPGVGEYERLLMSIKTTARKELVLLHPERSVPPGSTREWLKSRSWISAHHHVEMPGISRSRTVPVVNDPKAVQALRNLKQKLETSIQRYQGHHTTSAPGRPHHFSDFARLARRLCGKSIGLVLGGGGARGCAHLGVLRALEERGIPVDMVGGTSIGSLVGGLFAKEAELVSTWGRAKKFSGRMASLWRFASDLTYPVVSYTTGHEFNRGIFKALSDTHIEDMWLPFFANSVNLTWSRMEVHTTGYAWRYVRASMTLAGLIPPLVDDGHMLVDGGYVDNLPVSVMLAMGARDVFAVDVGSIDDTSPRSYGDTLSGWWVLINKWNPWSDARNIPTIPDIQGRLTYVSSVKTLEEAKAAPGCLYMRMPVEGFGTLEFGKFNEIAELGYVSAVKMLDEWDTEGRLPTGVDMGGGEEEGVRKRRGVAARRNSV